MRSWPALSVVASGRTWSVCNALYLNHYCEYLKKFKSIFWLKGWLSGLGDVLSQAERILIEAFREGMRSLGRYF
jgi:hypothetical protein